MLKFARFLQKRPSDRTILAIRVFYAVTLAAFLFFTRNDYSLPFVSGFWTDWVPFALSGAVLIPGIVAAFGWCVAKRKTVRIFQLAGSLLLFILSLVITAPESPVPNVPSPSASSVNASDLVKTETPPPSPIRVSGWLVLFAMFPLLSGITGKMVTDQCRKHGETIQKIRV